MLLTGQATIQAAVEATRLGAVDVLIVAYLIYRVLLMIRGTRAAQMLVGLFLIVTVALAVTAGECALRTMFDMWKRRFPTDNR